MAAPRLERLVRRAFRAVPPVLGSRRSEDLGTPGLPDGIGVEDLSVIDPPHTGNAIANLSHERLSNWKPGTSRIRFRAADGSWMSAIFKNADYDSEIVPGTRDLPIPLGEPEFNVLGRDNPGALVVYLPRVYFARCIRAGVHYQYLLEDLGSHWYRPMTRGDIYSAARHVPTLHKALDLALADEESRFPRYDSVYSRNLRAYCKANLDKLVAQSPRLQETGLWDQLGQLFEVHAGAEPDPSDLELRLIHGDLNNANVHLKRWGRHNMKAVDWEWAGLGPAHIDFASLTKGAPAEVRQRVVAEYSSINTQISPSMHVKTYQWCLLQDAIRDAGYVAAQALESTRGTRVDPIAYVASALNRALQASHLLSD